MHGGVLSAGEFGPVRRGRRDVNGGGWAFGVLKEKTAWVDTMLLFKSLGKSFFWGYMVKVDGYGLKSIDSALRVCPVDKQDLAIED